MKPLHYLSASILSQRVKRHRLETLVWKRETIDIIKVERSDGGALASVVAENSELLKCSRASQSLRGRAEPSDCVSS
eukprot:8683419-Pyramimonas_sp.AAC.1